MSAVQRSAPFVLGHLHQALRSRARSTRSGGAVTVDGSRNGPADGFTKTGSPPKVGHRHRSVPEGRAVDVATAAGRHSRPSVRGTCGAKGVLRLGWWVVATVATVVCVATMVATAAAVLVLHVSISPVLSGSMRGAFDPGAVLVSRAVPTRSVRVGDVVVFVPPGHVDSFAHRVQTVATAGTATVITTKGDANPVADPWRARLTGPTVQRVELSVPRVGFLLVLLQRQRPGTVATLGLGVLLAALGSRTALRQLRSSRRPPRGRTTHAFAE